MPASTGRARPSTTSDADGSATGAPMLPLPPEAVVDPRIGSSGPCLLALEDGTVFRGVAFGAPRRSGGDLVVNTSQTGYQEVCTDPSYAGQVVVMTYPLIGNHGRFADDDQSEQPWLAGLVVGHATAAVLGRARQIVHLLRSEGVPAMAGLDTRALARHLRARGSLRGVITAPDEIDPEAAVALARAVPAWERRASCVRSGGAVPGCASCRTRSALPTRWRPTSRGSSCRPAPATPRGWPGRWPWPRPP